MVTSHLQKHADTTIRVLLGWAKKRLKKQTKKLAAIVSGKPAAARKRKA